MPEYRGLIVDEPAGKRWELALSLLKEGGEPVQLGSLTVYRAGAGPAQDGLIHIGVESPHEPERVTAEVARAALAHAVEQVQGIIASDPRFGELVDRFGSVYEYVYDYGMGGQLVALSHGDGDLEWRGP